MQQQASSNHRWYHLRSISHVPSSLTDRLKQPLSSSSIDFSNVFLPSSVTFALIVSFLYYMFLNLKYYEGIKMNEYSH